MPKVVKMIANASGPEGTWVKSYQYVVPDHIPLELAEKLVAGGAAEWMEGQSAPEGPSPGGRVRMEGPALEVGGGDASEEEDDAKDE